MHTQRGFLFSPIALLIIVIFAVGAYLLYGFSESRKNVQFDPQNPIPYIEQSKTPEQPSKSGKKIDIPIPGENGWVKYSPECKNLKENIETFYPKGWFASEYVDIRDLGDETGQVNQCQVTFSYGAKSISPQAPNVGEIANIHISVWVNNTETLDNYTNIIINQEHSGYIGLSKETVNSIDYRVFLHDDGEGKTYVTKNDQFFIRISLHGSKGGAFLTENEFTEIDLGESIKIINKGFIERVKII